MTTINTNANGYRLPKDAEWEWAARGGQKSLGYIYSGSNDINAVAWYEFNSPEGAKPVGTKLANELGIQDMSGNVYEWCENLSSGTLRRLRGGSWFLSPAEYCAVSRRALSDSDWYHGSLGFRLARNAVVTPPAGVSMIQVLGNETVSTFQIGQFEVSWNEWREVRVWAIENGYTDLAGVGGGNAGDHPVHSVNWYDVAKWCNAKSEMEGLTPVYLRRGAVYRTGQSNDFNIDEWDRGDFQPKIAPGANGYRLPSVAEWEWAARGGVKSLGYTYSGSNDINDVAWWSGNSGGSTRVVGQKQANELGLHDMSGNVAEWAFDPMPYMITRNRVRWAELGRPRCGSSWASGSSETVAVRYRINEPEVAGRSANVGFRVARNAP